MNEEEFRTKLNELGTSYQLAIARMNAVDSPGLKNRHRRVALAVIDEIQALERRRKVEGDGALGRALWEGKRAVESFKIRPNDLMIVEAPEITWAKIRSGTITSETINGRTWHPDDVKTVETWSGQRFTRSVEKPEPSESLSPWIEYHDQLVKEWFDGEKALIDDLYPSAPAKPEEPIYRPFSPGEVQAAKIIGAFALAAIVIFISTLYLWA